MFQTTPNNHFWFTPKSQSRFSVHFVFLIKSSPENHKPDFPALRNSRIFSISAFFSKAFSQSAFAETVFPKRKRKKKKKTWESFSASNLWNWSSLVSVSIWICFRCMYIVGVLIFTFFNFVYCMVSRTEEADLLFSSVI